MIGTNLGSAFLPPTPIVTDHGNNYGNGQAASLNPSPLSVRSKNFTPKVR